jgi:hypothetical protein
MRYCGNTNETPQVEYCTYFAVNYLALPGGCTSSVVMMATTPVTLQYYVVGFPKKTIANLDWTTNSGTCTSTYITYKVMMVNPTNADVDSSVIKVESNEVKIETSDAAKVGSYGLKLEGFIGNYLVSNNKIFTVIVCSLVAPASYSSSFTYTIGSGVILFDIPYATFAQTNCDTFVYAIDSGSLLAGVTLSIPNYIPLRLSIDTSDVSYTSTTK